VLKKALGDDKARGVIDDTRVYGRVTLSQRA
jgi:hypothetical protein